METLASTNSFSRRAFIRSTLLASAALTSGSFLPITSQLSPLFSVAHAGEIQTTPLLAVRTGKEYAKLLRGTITALGGIESYVKSGETVIVKPNIGWDRTPELAANTHPELVKEMILLCLEAGAKRVEVFDRSANDPRRCYESSGIKAAVESIKSDRVAISHMDRRAYKELDIDTGVELKKWSIYLPAIEADRLINMPIAKHHSISEVTLAMKNIMGVIGGNRGVLHRKLPESLADLNTIIHSDLTVIDATRVLIANGPQGGRLEDVKILNTLVASSDIIAADAYAATLLGHKPEDIETIVAGARRGLGVIDLSKVKRV